MKQLSIFISLGISLFLLIISCNNVKSTLVGSPAPEFTLQNTESVSFSLDQFRGKKVLLHFWADWCASCRAEFPKLESAYQQLKFENFEIIAVNAGQSREHVLEFKEQFNITFPMLVDKQAVVAGKYEVRGLPMNFLIDEQGNVSKIILGWLDEEMISQALRNGH